MEFFKKNNINENDTYKSVKVSRVKSQPKIFGVGYRIPTQGMSSTFAFTVADILPEVSGDVIIVPREFTSQTGSDFDVDKIFLATKEFDVHGNEIKIRERDEEGKYIDKKLDECHGDELTEELSNADEKAVRNILLNSYISILTEKNNFSSARQSLDVVTDVLRTKFVDRVQQ